MPDPNAQLAAVLTEAAITYNALAREVRAVSSEAGQPLGTGPSAVAYWVAGGTPSGQTPFYIAEALTRRMKRTVTVDEIGLGSAGTGPALPTDPLVAVADLGRFVMLRRRDFLHSAFATAAVAVPLAYDHHAVAATLRAAARQGAAGAGEINTVRELTETFRTADDKLGGGHGLTTATTYLTDTVIPLLKARFPTEDLRRQAYGAAAQLACLIGWKCHDLSREGAAQRYYQVGYQLACEADPNGHGAWMLRAMTHQALDLGHPDSCVDLSEAALQRARGKVDRQTEALLLVTCARAYGTAGQTKQAASALLRAEEAAADTTDPVATYAAGSGPVTATIASHTAKTLTAMRDHSAAERHYRTALAGRAPDSYQRGHALTMVNLGKSVAAQRRHEEAVRLWHRCIDVMDGLNSDRTKQEITTIKTASAGYARRGIPGAATLTQRATELLRNQP
ncbi:tetratricopeptide repeat protein [Streptomyces sp. NPDC046374]|uniref:tetratricopeptide repeat protein n=1 Tax=Streptomyces sp. NPDC046374 TaxID=3154917 RepID=UPI0033F0ED6F